MRRWPIVDSVSKWTQITILWTQGLTKKFMDLQVSGNVLDSLEIDSLLKI